MRFHNGSEFTAEDVAFTFERVPNVPNSPSSFAIYTRPIRAVEIVDPLTMRLRTAGPYPLMPIDLANVRILDRETHARRRRPRTSTPAAPRSAPAPSAWSPTATATASSSSATTPIGATGRPMQRVDYRMITNDAARTAALLAGDVDFIDQVPTSDIARLRARPAGGAVGGRPGCA